MCSNNIWSLIAFLPVIDRQSFVFDYVMPVIDNRSNSTFILTDVIISFHLRSFHWLVVLFSCNVLYSLCHSREYRSWPTVVGTEMRFSAVQATDGSYTRPHETRQLVYVTIRAYGVHYALPSNLLEMQVLTRSHPLQRSSTTTRITTSR